MASSTTEVDTFALPDTLKRLVKDITYLYKNPLTQQGIYYQHDMENMLLGYAMIIGPEDTPYHNGFYFFIFIGITDDGIPTKRSAIAIANTAKTNQTRKIIKTRNISLARLLIVVEAISAILLPFSLTLVTNAPKS